MKEVTHKRYRLNVCLRCMYRNTHSTYYTLLFHFKYLEKPTWGYFHNHLIAMQDSMLGLSPVSNRQFSCCLSPLTLLTHLGCSLYDLFSRTATLGEYFGKKCAAVTPKHQTNQTEKKKKPTFFSPSQYREILVM